jgi:Fe-Mn family superoxide dismutase
MTYQEKDFSSLIGTAGFSKALLENHFTLYKGYVANTNKVSGILKELADAGKTAAPEFAELKRRFGWEFNGMRLHEYYFGNMSPAVKPFSDASAIGKKIIADFGSYAAWEKDFLGTGAMRGIGWVVLCQDPMNGQLFNSWINEHDLGFLAGAKPLLVMDVFEHAFILDYGTKRADYLAAFMKAIEWNIVDYRLSH